MNQDPPPGPRLPRHLLPCVALAGLCTLLNALKPLHMDDAAYYCFAVQAADAPLSPYGFEMLWRPQPYPANEVLAPPLLPYWWALGLRLFGDRPFLWKLWLFPLALALVLALHSLLRRCARGPHLPLLWLIVLSPSLLPGLNLMLDVPALALGLSALALFLRASDRGRLGAALLAGVVAGLAAQTKYTALPIAALFVLHGVLFRRARLGFAAAAVAALVFVGWEAFVAVRHGQSHLLANVGEQCPPLWSKIGPLLRALLNLAGGLAPATALLGLVALGWSRRAVAAAGVILPACLLADALVYRLLGLLLCGVVIAAAWRLLRVGSPSPRSPAAGNFTGLTAPPRRTDVFLVLWLALELVSYVVLTPFPAARRILGPVVAATLLVGRLAARTCRAPERAALVRGVAAAGVVLGLAFYAVDLCEAVAVPRAAERAAPRVRAHGAGGTVWYVGTWGLKFHAERRGMKPIWPGRSCLRPGDWVVIPDEPFPRQRSRIADAPLRRVDRVAVDDRVPVRTVGCYYGGNVPLEPHRRPRIALTLYRVTASFTPDPPPIPVCHRTLDRARADRYRNGRSARCPARAGPLAEP